MRALRQEPRRVFDGFGFAVLADSPFLRPRSADEVAAVFRRATEEGVPVAMRGNGRSYGDAALVADDGVVVDMMGMRRVLSWDPANGIAEVEPGVTIEDLWRHTLKDGWWPRVVPGTMFATIGGTAAMNVHGKNHWKMGGTGDAILDFDLVTPAGETLRCSREENADVFYAAIAGFGMLGTFTRIRLQLKQVDSGVMRVAQMAARNWAEQFALFEEWTPKSDYFVSWVDSIAGGGSMGRGQSHRAHYVHDHGKELLDPAKQDLPGHILGVPKGLVSKLLGLFNFNAGMRLTNTVKYLSSVLGPKGEYDQGHVAFHFLLDYVPGFRDAYRPTGFIQYQPFVPKEHAPGVFAEITRRMQARGIVSYLSVMKKHRPDDFLLSHVVDGYSLAMDVAVTNANRVELWKLCGELNDLVCEAGGRFYPAKDLTVRPQDFQRAWGQERIAKFRAIRKRVDPAGILRTQWAKRVGVDG